MCKIIFKIVRIQFRIVLNTVGSCRHLRERVLCRGFVVLSTHFIKNTNKKKDVIKLQ